MLLGSAGQLCRQISHRLKPWEHTICGGRKATGSCTFFEALGLWCTLGQGPGHLSGHFPASCPVGKRPQICMNCNNKSCQNYCCCLRHMSCSWDITTLFCCMLSYRHLTRAVELLWEESEVTHKLSHNLYSQH